MFDSVEEDEIFGKIMLKQHIHELQEKDQAIIGLISVGYRQEEVAKILGISRQAAGSAYRRILEFLRKKIEEDYQ